ncbi:hypothetical protein HDU76_012935 [Blyttiomyces sp. JEL0837]|nr:hypothetical protein HDU76_012935 [Blyttiomyces sp. JEL0837]
MISLIYAVLLTAFVSTNVANAAANRLQYNEPRGVFKVFQAHAADLVDNTQQDLYRRGGGTSTGASSSTSATPTSTSASSATPTSSSLSSSISSLSSSTTTAIPSSSGTTTSLTATSTTPSQCTTSATAQPTIRYLGGPLLVNGINIYGIFYGEHSDDTISKVGQFVNSVGKSSRWAVDRTYVNSNGQHISDNVTWVGFYHDSALSQGTVITGKSSAIIDNAVAKMGWPSNDPNGIYPIFVGAGITESMGTGKGYLCTDYCGYHNSDLLTQRNFVILVDATACPGTLPAPGQCKGTHGCMQTPWRNTTDTTYSINRNQHADSMVNILLHEIGETASDYRAGYRDANGDENADKCAYEYIKTYGSGSDIYNVDFASSGGSKYLVQSQWSLPLQACAISA